MCTGHVCICIAAAQSLCCQRRFPDSESSSHFWSNLLAGKNMCTQDNRRWPVGLHGTPERFGKLVEYNLFDASFFSVHGKQAQVSRALLLQSLCMSKQWTCQTSKTSHRPKQCRALGTITDEADTAPMQCGHNHKDCLPNICLHCHTCITPRCLCVLWKLSNAYTILVRGCRGWTRSCASCWSAPTRPGWTPASTTAPSAAAARFSLPLIQTLAPKPLARGLMDVPTKTALQCCQPEEAHHDRSLLGSPLSRLLCG